MDFAYSIALFATFYIIFILVSFGLQTFSFLPFVISLRFGELGLCLLDLILRPEDQVSAFGDEG